MDDVIVLVPLGQQLIDAAKQGTSEPVGALLDQGVAVDSRDDGQRTALLWASYRGHRAVASLLVDRGANVNAETANGYTPATQASWCGHVDTLQLLVSRGADIHHRCHSGYSSLLLAALEDHLPVCEYLISLGADLMAATNDNLWTVLGEYGVHADPRLSPETIALRVAALEAEHAYRPLQLRALAIAIAAAELDPAVAVVAPQPSSTRQSPLWFKPLACRTCSATRALCGSSCRSCEPPFL